MTALNDPAAVAARRLEHHRGVTRVVALAAALLALASAITIEWIIPMERVSDLHAPWWALMIGFALAEMLPVHFEYRREAHTFSLSTIVLVVGLFTATPLELVVAHLAGLGLALAMNRGQAVFKLDINLSSAWIDTAVAVLVFRALVPADGLELGGWGAAFAAAATCDLVSAIGVVLAISLYQWRWERAMLAPTIIGIGASVINTSLGLVGVILLGTRPAAVLLLGVVGAMLVLAYRAYAGLREKHRSLELLYDFTREMGSAVLGGRVLTALLDETREMMHAEEAWLYLPDPTGGGTRATVTADGTVTTSRVAPGEPEERLHVDAHLAACSRFVETDDTGRMRLCDAASGQAIAGPLVGASGSIGTLVVTERSGEVRPFAREDQRVFETLSNHASITLENSRLVERLREEVASKEHQSLHDGLTGLPNRTMFRDRLERVLRRGSPSAVLLIDLDRFKDVNDTLGHHNGDLLLQEVATRLRTALRQGDTIARLGGDEFAVLLPDVGGPEAAVHIAHGIRAALEQPLALADVEIDVGASIGISLFPDHGADPAALLQRADVAMYTAKADQSGVELYTEARDEYSTDRLALVGELRWAVEKRELLVHYQPQIDIATGEVIGAEALLRWNHPRRGNVPPDEFISIAEQTGLIRPLTVFVLEEALHECADWRRRGIDLRVSVNLSARNLLEPELAADVARLLVAFGVPAGSLCLELTETSIMADPRRTLEVMQRLHVLGVELAIDDFGTGYSSLGRLTALPVSEIKVDKSFVMNMASRPSDEVIVRSIVDLARNLGLAVVAEGVEDTKTLDLLRQLRCDRAQGFLVSRPVPAAEFVAWLAAYGNVNAGEVESSSADVIRFPDRTPLRTSTLG